MIANNDSQKTTPLTKRLATAIRREQIAETSLKLISLHGLEALNIVAIAEDIGLAPSAIYRHFSGKEEILESVSGLLQDRLLGNVRRVCAETDDPLKRLHLLLQSHLNLVLKGSGIPRYVFATGSEGVQSTRKLRLFKAVELYLKKVATLFYDGQQVGKIRPELDPDILSYMYLGLIQPGILLQQMSDGEFDIESHVEAAWEIFSKTISVTSQSGQPRP